LFLKFYLIYIFLLIILSTSNYLATIFFNFVLLKIYFLITIIISFFIFFQIGNISNCLNFSMSIKFLLNIKIFIWLIIFFLIYNLYLFENILSLRNLIIIIFWRLNLIYLLHFSSLLIILAIGLFFWNRLIFTLRNYFIKIFLINFCFTYCSLRKWVLLNWIFVFWIFLNFFLWKNDENYYKLDV